MYPLHLQSETSYALCHCPEYICQGDVAKLSWVQAVSNTLQLVQNTVHFGSDKGGATSLQFALHSFALKLLCLMALATLNPRRKPHQRFQNGLNYPGLFPKQWVVNSLFQRVCPALRANGQLLGRVRRTAQKSPDSILDPKKVANCIPQGPPPPIRKFPCGRRQRRGQPFTSDPVNVHGMEQGTHVLAKFLAMEHLQHKFGGALPLWVERQPFDARAYHPINNVKNAWNLHRKRI